MRKTLIIPLFAGLAITVSAQSKIDFFTTSVLSHASASKTAQAKHIKSRTAAIDNEGNLSLLIEALDDTAIADLEAKGAVISGVYGNIIACSMPASNVTSLEDCNSIKRVTAAKRRRLLNDKGRAANAMNVDAVHEGTSLSRAYKGDGVVVGLFDTGLDPNHINFFDDNGETSRVKRVWAYTVNERTGRVSVKTYSNPSSIASFSTDDAGETHGTHVLGTIAGSYDGGTSSTSYYGMAPHAEIAIACGDAADDAILAGVKNIAAYAASQNKPVVINLSLGTNVGHHDGTDAFTTALDAIAKDTPLVLAAGNEADLNIALRKTFTSSDTRLMTIIEPSYYTTSDYGYNCQGFGNIEVISDTSEKFTISLGLYNTSTRKLVSTLPISSANWTYWTNSGADVDGTRKTDTNFTSAFDSDSYFGAAAAICPDNDRYYSFIDLDLDYKSSKTIVPVIIVDGKAGQTVDIYTDSYTELASRNITGFTDGSTDGTISDMACGHNTISVGAYATRNAYPYSGETLNDILSYSSYGKLLDGRTLPHITAPGQAIVSSMSTPYRSSGNWSSSSSKIYSTVSANGRSNYWCHMGGTSMAAPGVTGCLALWLEANPKLTPAELREIAMKTARKDSYVTGGKAQASYQWGAGKLDALEGLKLAITYGDAGVDNIASDNDSRLLVNDLGNNCYEFFLAGRESISAAVYSVSGALMTTAASLGDTVEVDCSALAPGIYIINVNGHSTKIAIR